MENIIILIMKRIANEIETPDGKWRVVVREDGTMDCFNLHHMQGKYTMEEILDAFHKLERE